MTMNEDFTRGFFNTLVILRSYLSEIVIGGGWAPFLYYRYLVGDRNHDPVLTSDIDLMVKHQVPTFGSKTIDELLTEANLEAKFKTLDTPPIIHYEGKIEGVDVEIEFLTDQTGSRQDTVLEVQKSTQSGTGNSCQISQRILKAPPPKAPCASSSKDQRMHFLDWMMIN